MLALLRLTNPNGPGFTPFRIADPCRYLFSVKMVIIREILDIISNDSWRLFPGSPSSGIRRERCSSFLLVLCRSYDWRVAGLKFSALRWSFVVVLLPQEFCRVYDS